jgi:hypothetical protein
MKCRERKGLEKCRKGIEGKGGGDERGQYDKIGF